MERATLSGAKIYFKERRPLEEWWNNHVLPQHSVESLNGTYLNDYLKLCETISFENIVFAIEGQQSLSRAMKLQNVDYSQSESVEDR